MTTRTLDPPAPPKPALCPAHHKLPHWAIHATHTARTSIQQPRSDARQPQQMLCMLRHPSAQWLLQRQTCRACLLT